MMQLKQVIISRATTGQQWLGIPGIERTPAGRLFVTWFSGGDTEPAPENAVYISRCEPGGAAFGPPELMAAPDADGTRAYDSALWIDPTGVLWLIYNRSNRAAREHGVWVRTCADPDAPEPVWSAPRQIPFPVPYMFRLNKPTVLTTGEWLMPMTFGPRADDQWFTDRHRQNLQGVGLSTDGGRTWALHGDVKAPPLASENMVIENRDGSVTMYIRSGGGVIWQSRSHDGGRTWSEGEPTTIPHPGSRFFLRQLPDGDWLLIHNPEAGRRTGLEARVSRDEGASWSAGLVLDERDLVSYPDAVITPEGTILCVHDRERNAIYGGQEREHEGAGEILLSTFSKADIPVQEPWS